MSEVNCKINSSKSAKPQALAFINELKKVLPIERTRMHLRITCKNVEQFEHLHKWLQENFNNQYTITSEKTKDDAFEVLMSIEPALFREISNLVKQEKVVTAEKEPYLDITIEIVDAM